ncbi:MAG: HlyD family efflux transporter periplasmic adaptor subunit [Pseudohongiellaceae bacterium]
MDIVKTPKQVSLYRRFWYAPLIAVALIVIAIIANKYRNVTYLASRDSLLIDQVRSGDLSVTVRGYGQLASRDVYWIGAETQGRVARVVAKPGDLVAVGDVLVELVNPQLLQELKDAELELAARQAEMRANQVARETLLLDLQTQAASAEIDHQSAKMDVDAKAELMSDGLQIVSRLDFERSQLAVQKYQQRWDMQLNLVTQSRLSMMATQEAEQARLSQTENELQKIRDQVSNLSVLATAEGIVQEMGLELGQLLASGQNITRIARPDQLVAEVQIQELQVNDITIGMSATVDTRTSEIKGVVSRIDPAVIDGSVLVEIELQGKLPPEVRPDLNIEANISIAHVANTLSVRRPVFARPGTEAQVYRLTSSGEIAEQVSVRYGEASTNYIEILEGLAAGDRIIVSDPSAFNTHERIYIR